MLLVSNRSLAEHNMSLEPKLTEGKRALIAAYEEASKLADSISSMKAAVAMLDSGAHPVHRVQLKPELHDSKSRIVDSMSCDARQHILLRV
ncbi:hypothetical protein FHG87_018092 [Trinorchestia longiramus]|nr:hypothetical protein FHG87_018092 [Trinorchestia longiramus]